ncbi:MAG TPA: mandelate racemase/muconate lactonizing enzyme family protein [Burkholderiales bacterium]|nr:mandelate racemase/muconate lactonizing enzyme family protein [Burkholderiales bacterium]
MKIVDVRTHCLASPLETPFAFSQGWVKSRGACLVEVQTDAGFSGWGEALCQGLQPPQIAAAAIESALKPLLIGADPLQLEPLWQRMYMHTRDYGMKGALMAAISGVDIALWDVAGKHLGQPVWRLLGGAHRERVQIYATGFYRVKGQGEAPRLADEAEQRAAEGFRFLKIKLGFGVADDLAVMQAVARAVEGKGLRMMIDTNHAYGVADAVRLGRALAPLDLRWYEEPVAAEDLAGYRELRAKLEVPIAGGENEFGAWGFRSLLEARAVDIAQPDVCAAGGFTACRHIAALALAHGVQVNPHVWGSSVGQVASLHLACALPLANPSLFADEPVFEYDCSSHPFRETLIDKPLRQREGWLERPEGPGLGIEVDRKALERFRA